MKIFKDKEGNKLTFKEFLTRWKSGIESINPLQKIKTQILGTRIVLIGLLLGLVMSIIGWKKLWWVGIILIGALINTGIQYLALIQQRKLLDNVEKQFELPKEPQDNSPQPRVKQSRGGELKPKGDCTYLDNGSPEDAKEKKKKPKVVIIDNNPLSIAGYAEEFPETWEKICNALDKEKGGKK